LDVATGPGWVAAQAAERGASVVGIDVAEAMIARARNAYPGLEFRRAPNAPAGGGPQRIRVAFDRVVEGYRRRDGLELPVAIKLASARMSRQLRASRPRSN
jgi:SAM-dependent methyltransferase